MRTYNQETMTDPEGKTVWHVFQKIWEFWARKKRWTEAANGRKSSKWDVGLGLKMWGNKHHHFRTTRTQSSWE